MRRSAILLAIAAAAIGCSSGNDSSPGGDPTPGDPNMATVTLAAAFPGSGARSLIDTRTTSILVEIDDMASFATSVVLTPALRQTTLTVPPGYYSFKAKAKDAGGTVLETAATAGKVIAGPNSVVITFLAGTWTLAAPAVTFSNGWSLSKFYLAEDPSPNDGPAAFETSVPKIKNSYKITWDLNDGAGGLMGEARIRAYTQFGGSTVNRSTFDGGGYNLTNRCGESYDDPPFPGACPDGGPGAPSELWIRIIGDVESGDDCGNCQEGERAIRRLPPPSRFYPDAGPITNTQVVTGTQIAGTMIEYQHVRDSQTFLEGLTGPYTPPPPPSAAALTPDAEFAVTVTEYRVVVACRDGFNNTTPNGLIDHGGWRLNRAGPDTDLDGEPDYYEEGWWDSMLGGVGECNHGLRHNGDRGEWCDGSWNGATCNTAGGDNVPMPHEFVDIDHNGVVDTGGFYLSHLKVQRFEVAGHSYSFTATGAQTGGSTIMIQ